MLFPEAQVSVELVRDDPLASWKENHFVKILYITQTLNERSATNISHSWFSQKKCFSLDVPVIVRNICFKFQLSKHETNLAVQSKADGPRHGTESELFIQFLQFKVKCWVLSESVITSIINSIYYNKCKLEKKKGINIKQKTK